MPVNELSKKDRPSDAPPIGGRPGGSVPLSKFCATLSRVSDERLVATQAGKVPLSALDDTSMLVRLDTAAMSQDSVPFSGGLVLRSDTADGRPVAHVTPAQVLVVMPLHGEPVQVTSGVPSSDGEPTSAAAHASSELAAALVLGGKGGGGAASSPRRILVA